MLWGNRNRAFPVAKIKEKKPNPPLSHKETTDVEQSIYEALDLVLKELSVCSRFIMFDLTSTNKVHLKENSVFIFP